MFGRIIRAAAAVILLTAPLTAAAAQGQVELKGEVQQEKVVVENGQSKTTLIVPKTVLPGDRLLFTTAYANKGTAPVQNFVVTNPLPGAVALAPDATASLEVSVDGGKAWGRLALLTVLDGKGGRRPAQSTDVTHVRWTIPVIAPGANGQVSYHAIVR